MSEFCALWVCRTGFTNKSFSCTGLFLVLHVGLFSTKLFSQTSLGFSLPILHTIVHTEKKTGRISNLLLPLPSGVTILPKSPVSKEFGLGLRLLSILLSHLYKQVRDTSQFPTTYCLALGTPDACFLSDLNSDVPPSFAHQLNSCFVLLKRMSLSLAAGGDVVPPRIDVASQTPTRLSADENSSADDECLLLRVPETPDNSLPV
jgi:hypothetical protein